MFGRVRKGARAGVEGSWGRTRAAWETGPCQDPRPCQSCFGRECLAASAAKKLCHPSIPVERRLCAPIRCRGTASPRIATRRGGFAGPSTDQAPGFRADVFMGSHRNAVIAAGWTDANGGLSGFDGDMGGLPQSFPSHSAATQLPMPGCGLPASHGHGPGRCEPLQPRTGRDESRLARFLAHLQALRQRTPVTSLRELHALHGPVQ